MTARQIIRQSVFNYNAAKKVSRAIIAQKRNGEIDIDLGKAKIKLFRLNRKKPGYESDNSNQ